MFVFPEKRMPWVKPGPIACVEWEIDRGDLEVDSPTVCEIFDIDP